MVFATLFWLIRPPVPVTPCLSPEAALRELLKEKAHGYTVFNRGGLAEYTAGAVSLRTGTSSVPLMDLLPAEWVQRLTPENLLVSDSEREDRLHELGIDAYVDKKLASDPASYADYLVDLHEAGMVSWDIKAKCTSAPFFVHKRGVIAT